MGARSAGNPHAALRRGGGWKRGTAEAISDGVGAPVLDPTCERPGVKLLRPTHPAVTTKMVRHYGRSPRGERLVASVPHGHWKTLTFIAALRFDGMTAPYAIDGAMDGPTFIAYVEQVLTPILKKGDVVFMDNLRTHKVDGVRQAIEAVGASVRYLPAYSPDLVVRLRPSRM
jgi:DDE superfamily endonuclease